VVAIAGPGRRQIDYGPIHVNMSKKRKPPLPASDEKVDRLLPAVDLPISYYKGIGRVIAAHAILENNVSELVFDLMKIGSPEGRVAFEYRAASTMFALVRKLLALRGIEPNLNVADLGDQISDLCKARDQLAHGLWVKRNGMIALRLTEGTYDTPEGRRSRAILPEGKTLPDNYFEHTRQLILDTAGIVNDLREQVRSALSQSLNKQTP
jgi:hypothetical protein